MSDEQKAERMEAFDALVQREKERADALPDNEASIELTQDGITVRAVEKGGDIRVTVTDVGDELAVLDLPPLGADALGEGLIALASKARGEDTSGTGYTTRPSRLEDVADKIKAGRTVGRIDLSELIHNPDAMSAATDFINALNRVAGIRFRSEYGSPVIVRTYTPEEEDELLAEAKRAWDRTRDEYEDAAEAGLEPKDVAVKLRIERFCEAEALPLPWDRPRVGDLR